MDISSVDHIVYAFSDLNEGIKIIKECTGVEPIVGGQHLNHGTHNALLALGKKCYLEIIAPDPNNQFDGTRWMAVDHIEKPTITRWSINTNNIQEDAQILSDHDKSLGEIIAGERQLKDGHFLKWQMTKPSTDGIVNTIPFLLDWSQSANHPCDVLDLECKLIEVKLHSTKANSLENIIGTSSNSISYHPSGRESIQIVMKTPKGIVCL